MGDKKDISNIVLNALTHSTGLDPLEIQLKEQKIKGTHKPHHKTHFLIRRDMGKDFIVNGKQYRVCPNQITGNIVLVNKRKITIEVLNLGSDMVLILESSSKSSEKPRYYHEDATPELYSVYNENQRPIFNHYLKFFE